VSTSIATFVAQPSVTPDGSDPILFSCLECQDEVPATESDSHAHRKHSAAQIRVFGSQAIYDDWARRERALAQIKELA
jgi:hypothetical protein